MARNLSLVMGRPTPFFGIRDVVGEVRDVIALIAAAGRVGSAVDARTAPKPQDLERIGLTEADVLRPPFRF